MFLQKINFEGLNLPIDIGSFPFIQIILIVNAFMQKHSLVTFNPSYEDFFHFLNTDRIGVILIFFTGSCLNVPVI